MNIYSFDIVSRFISTLRNLLDSTQLHFHLFLKSISHLSSILVLLDEEKGDYQKLLSELQKFVKVAVDNKKQVESVDEHRQRSKKIYLLHAICTVGGEQKHYKLCAKLRDSLESDREEGVIAGDQLSLLTHAITVLRPLRNIKGDTKGIVQKFNDRKDWHEKAQISYQLAVLVNSENVHKNFASELKGFLKHLIENRASLGFEARNRVLFGLAVIRCQRKSFERLREYLRINLPEFSTPDEEAIFRKACVIGAQTTKQNWGKLESSKQSSHLAMPEIDHLLDLTEQLSSAELFQKIPFEEVSHIARISKSETFSESTTLFSKGDKGDGAYVILKGGGKVLIKGKVIDKLPVGSMVGEMALLDEKTRSASVIVEKGTTVLKIAQKDFDKLRKGNIKISNGLTEQLVRRLRHSHAKNQKLQTLLEGYRRQVSIKRKRRNSVRFAKVKAPSPSLKRIQSVQVIGGKTSSSQSSKKTSLRSPRVVTLRGSMSFLKDSTGSSKRKRRRSTGQKQKKPMKKAYSFSVLSRRKSTPATPRKPSSHLPNSIQAIPEETSS